MYFAKVSKEQERKKVAKLFVWVVSCSAVALAVLERFFVDHQAWLRIQLTVIHLPLPPEAPPVCAWRFLKRRKMGGGREGERRGPTSVYACSVCNVPSPPHNTLM